MKAKLMLLSTLLLPTLAFASGGYSGSSSTFSSSAPAPQPVDQAYEYGKALYNGKTDEIADVDFCVQDEEKQVKIKSSSLKAYKGGSYDDLAQNLYNCDDPQQNLLAVADQSQATYIVYYLDQRYNLDLDQ